jgi:drug/metabolite transporter (DMT)-like permease
MHVQEELNNQKMKRSRLNMFAIGLVLVCVVFGALGQISMKTGMGQVRQINSFSDLFNPNTIRDIFGNFYVLGGLFFYIVATFLWLGALSTLNVSSIYPLLSLGYVLTAILAIVFLGEVVTSSGWCGIALVVIGCVLILRS